MVAGSDGGKVFCNDDIGQGDPFSVFIKQLVKKGMSELRAIQNQSTIPGRGQGRQQTIVVDKQCKVQKTQESKHKGKRSVMPARQIKTLQSSVGVEEYK